MYRYNDSQYPEKSPQTLGNYLQPMLVEYSGITTISIYIHIIGSIEVVISTQLPLIFETQIL